MKIIVAGDKNEQRLDRIITEVLNIEGLPFTRTLVQDNISKNIQVNSSVAKKSYKLKEGDVIDIDLEGWKELSNSLDLSNEVIPQKGNLDIRYEDEDLLVIYKPKGLVVHPGVGNRENTLANYLRYYIEQNDEYDSLLDRSGIVHRLDKGVSGLMVVAKNKETQGHLKEQFQSHSVIKIYRAKVELSGKPVDTKFLDVIQERDVDATVQNLDVNDDSWKEWYKAEGYIGRSRKNRYKMEFKKHEWPNAKYALSYILPSKEEVLVKIQTGRMHQIRATLEYLGLHILGDDLYGVSKREYNNSDIMLEAVFLSFLKLNGERVTIKTYEG